MSNPTDTTLRMKLDKILNFIETPIKISGQRIDGVSVNRKYALDAIEALCQEIAREARPDSWYQEQYQRATKQMYEAAELLEAAAAELTQKPEGDV